MFARSMSHTGPSQGKGLTSTTLYNPATQSLSSSSSMEAAGKLGGGLVLSFGWKVQLKNPQLEVLLNIVGDKVTISMALNRESNADSLVAT